MKTIQFTGTEKHVEAIKNFHKNTWNKTDTLQQSETRVYVLDSQDFINDLPHSEEEFMTLAEENGRVYTIQGFQDAFNAEEINSAIDVVKFISVPLVL